MWVLHHDNAPSHVALSFKEFYAKRFIMVLEHPGEYTDLTVSDFFLIPSVKNHLRLSHFDTMKEIQ
jgi:hypothetical protein